MQLRSAAKLAGVACLAALLPMLMGPTGGYPSRPTFQNVVVQNPTGSVTALQAKNDGATDAEIIVTTSTAGNAQFRATNFGGSNWAFGNLRSTNGFALCNASTLTGQCYTFNTTGQVVFPAPTTGSTLSLTGIATGVSPALFIGGASGSAVVEINSGLSIAINSAGTDFGFLQNDIANHWCLAHGTSLSALGTCVVGWNTSNNATVANNLDVGGSLTQASVAVCLSNGTNCPAGNNLGACTFKIQSNGAAAPTVVSSRGCGTVSGPARSGVGGWNITTGLTMTTSWVGFCQFDGNGANPAAFNFVTVAPGNPSSSKISMAIWTSAVAAVDPAAAQQYVCTVGT